MKLSQEDHATITALKKEIERAWKMVEAQETAVKMRESPQLDGDVPVGCVWEFQVVHHFFYQQCQWTGDIQVWSFPPTGFALSIFAMSKLSNLRR